ncbi:MAG: Ig-like domain-containing protein [Bacteroidota bacterium]
MKLKFYSVFVVALCWLLPAKAQIINTMAGTGVAGYSGDGGVATAAKLKYPEGLDVDAAGNIYIADHDNNVVRKVAPSGIITTIAGTGVAGFSGDGGPATAAKLNFPFDIKLDNDGNIYVSDGWNHRIRKIDASGIISTVAGTGVPGFSGDGGLATAAQINEPQGLDLNSAGDLFFGEYTNNRVRKVNISTGIITTYAGNGVAGYSGDGGLATAAKLWHPNFIYIDAADNVYITDNQNHRIRKVTPAGIISTFAGNGTSGFSGDGGLATAARLSYPAGVTADAAGNFYIADHANHRVRKIDAAGTITTIAGTGAGTYGGDGGLATLAQLYKVTDVAFDNGGNLLIADQSNHRIRRIAGSNHPPHFTDGPIEDMALCQGDTLSLDTVLAVVDTDVSQTLTWSVATAPAHGTLVAAYSAVSTGGIVTPSGLRYVPTAGYSGLDNFKIAITDGTATDMIQIYVTVNPLPTAGTISGPGIVCAGANITLSVTGSAGTWSTVSSAIATVSSSGIVTGVASGTASVLYTVTSSCGTATATFPLTVITSSAGIIAGTDSVCPGDTIMLSASVAGGTWTSASASIATVSGGVVTGIVPGTTVISYTVTNACGTATAFRVVKVRPYAACAAGIATIEQSGPQTLNIVPNPGTGMFKMEMPGKEPILMIVVTDVLGRVVLMSEMAGAITATVGIHAPAGQYSVRAVSATHYCTGKLLILQQ